MQRTNPIQANIVIIGAGPVGLWTAIQFMEEKKKDFTIQMLEKYDNYHELNV